MSLSELPIAILVIGMKSRMKSKRQWEREWNKSRSGWACITNELDKLVGGAQMPPEERVLELGCGFIGSYSNGEGIKYPTASFIPNYIGVDISINALRHSASWISSATFGAGSQSLVNADMVSYLPFASDSFDCVLSVSTFTTLGADIVEVLGEAARVIKPSGALIFEATHFEMFEKTGNLAKGEIMGNKIFDYNGMEVIGFSEKGIKALLRSKRLAVERIFVEEETRPEPPYDSAKSGMYVKAIKRA